MVCKEEILSWFKDLDSYKRIDILCEMINMCLPFELRFVGSCMEDIGKCSYHELRQQELLANNLEKLEKDVVFKNHSLYEQNVRHRILVNISLLKSKNQSVANWYSKKFLRTDYIEDLIHKDTEDSVQNELLLLFTMASRHPAFTFDQKQFFNDILLQLYEIRNNRLFKSSTNYGYPPGFGYPTTVYKKVNDTSVLLPMHPPGLPRLDMSLSHFRNWPAIPCGAPNEVRPYPVHHSPLQPPQPPSSPLVSSPNQSRSNSPHRTSSSSLLASNRPPPPPPPTALNLLTTPNPTITIPNVTPTGVVQSAPGIPPQQIPAPGGVYLPTTISVASVPTMMPVPLEALAPPTQLNQSSQPPSLYNQQVQKQGQQECDELSSTIIKDESLGKPSLIPWLNPVSNEIKPINGIRMTQYPQPPPPPSANTRIALVDQLQSMNLNEIDENYQSASSSSSPGQTPPDTPPNLPSSHNFGGGGGGGTSIDKGRPNGAGVGGGGGGGGGGVGVGGNYIPSFGDSSPPPAAPTTFTFPAYAAIQPNTRFFTNTSFRPATANLQYAQYPSHQNTESTSYPTHYPFQYYSIMYPHASYTQSPNTLPNSNAAVRQPQVLSCYNCGNSGHIGQDCSQQSIDEITQKVPYSVEFSPIESDSGEK